MHYLVNSIDSMIDLIASLTGPLTCGVCLRYCPAVTRSIPLTLPTKYVRQVGYPFMINLNGNKLG